MLRMPSCLLKLTRVVLSHRPCALFILIFVFVSFAYIKLYWGIEEDPKSHGPTYSLSAEIGCAHHVPSPLITAGGPSPSAGNVFFVETSEQTSPSYLFSCSVESAARSHPTSRVVVLMKGLAKGNASLPKHWAFSLLSCFPNVEIQPLDLTELFSGTPLKRWYLWPLRHWEPHFLPVLSDACRIVLMWKFGGIYLDTDFIVLKNLQNLTNALGIQDDSELNGAFLSFKAKHKFMELCMQDFVQNYNGWVWGHQGPGLLTRVFKKWCSLETIKSMSCKGIACSCALRSWCLKGGHSPDGPQDFQKHFPRSLYCNNALEINLLWNEKRLKHPGVLPVPNQSLCLEAYSSSLPMSSGREAPHLSIPTSSPQFAVICKTGRVAH